MAYSTVVLGDEPLILEGLTRRVDWTAVNYGVVGSVSNGTVGKELLEQLRSDLVISGIKMLRLSEMELVELSYKRGYAPKFIVLTVYSDFASAQRAIRYQVEDYTLKPTDSQRLREAVQKAISGIQEMERKERKMQKLEEGIGNTQGLVTASPLFSVTWYSGDSMD